jgi:hypothetical protein
MKSRIKKGVRHNMDTDGAQQLLVPGGLLYNPRSGLAEVLAGGFLFPILRWTARRFLLQLIGLPLCSVGSGALL